LLAIAAKAMAKEPSARYPSARELAEDLRRFQTGQLVGAHRYSFGQLIGKWIRRHRAVVTVAAIALVVVAVLGVISVRRIVAERERADHERVAAEHARDNAQALVDFLIGDTQHQLQQLGRLDLLATMTRRVVEYYDNADRWTPEMQGKHGAAIVLHAGVLEASGDLAGAVAEVRRAIAVRTKLAQAQPGVVKWQRDLATGHRKLSDMLRKQNDVEGALVEANAALAIIQAAAERAPGDLAIRRDVAAAHKRVGDIRRARDDRAGALVAYQTALALREAIAEAEPADLDSQREVMIHRDRLGGMLLEQGEHASALVQFRAGLVVAEAAVARDPEKNRSRRLDLSVVHSRIGDALLAEGYSAQALA
jgi:tetratricopeptide (TPR) repeat protein